MLSRRNQRGWFFLPCAGARFKGICCYNYLCGPCAGSPCLDNASRPPLPPVSRGPGAFYSGKGFGKTLYSVYALIYIVAAAAVVSGVFLVVTSLTP